MYQTIFMVGGRVAEQVTTDSLAYLAGSGTTVALMTLDAAAVRPIGAGELLHIRRRDLAEPRDAVERE